MKDNLHVIFVIYEILLYTCFRWIMIKFKMIDEMFICENCGTKVDYYKDPRVQENIKKSNTITITGEGKVFIIIIIILLLFIFILPTVFDYVRNIIH